MPFYDTAAAGYDELHGQEQLRKLAIIRNELQLPQHAAVLDVGCGTGLSGVLPWNVVGVDTSAEMVKRSNVAAVVASGESLPFHDRSFDAVICVTVFHHFQNPEKALQEMKRVSKGLVVISLLKKSRDFERQLQLIREMTAVTKEIEEQHDVLLFCNRNPSVLVGKSTEIPAKSLLRCFILGWSWKEWLNRCWMT